MGREEERSRGLKWRDTEKTEQNKKWIFRDLLEIQKKKVPLGGFLLEIADEGGKKQERCREWFAFQSTEKDKQNSVRWD